MTDPTFVRILQAQVDQDGYVHGMAIQLEEVLPALPADATIIVTGPSGGQVVLHGEGTLDDGAWVVAAQIGKATTYHFRLVKIDERTRKLEMEPHHRELIGA
jgi:hypothetical protein